MSESEYFGKLAEAAACARYGLEEARCSWHDAVLPSGRPVESKTCRVWVSNGDRRTRGRWWIEREAHETLVLSDGMYALSIYDPQSSSGPILDTALIPAAWLSYLLTWSSTGGHHKGSEQAKVRWSALLSDPSTESEAVA